MILTTCAACAAPLAHDAPRCVRCKVRYCDSTCQHDHWRRGHKQMCKKIHRGGNAEQYNADKKYKEAVAVAVEACADDTKGQTCFICTQAFHWKTKEGLVRGCSCRGTAGFAHVSCLAEQAKILVADAEENNLDIKVRNERWLRWSACSLCEQEYHGVVSCALGWGCWKTYVGRPEEDWPRQGAMSVLGNALYEVELFEDSLSVREARLSSMARLGAPQVSILSVMSNIATTYDRLGRHEEALRTWQDVHTSWLNICGEENVNTLMAASNHANLLIRLRRFEEGNSLLRKAIRVARRVRGDNDHHVIRMRSAYAAALYQSDCATLNDIREAVATLEDTHRTARRVLGSAHPLFGFIERDLQKARAALRARETPGSA